MTGGDGARTAGGEKISNGDGDPNRERGEERDLRLRKGEGDGKDMGDLFDDKDSEAE